MVAAVNRCQIGYCHCQNPWDLTLNQSHPRKHRYHHYFVVEEDFAPYSLKAGSVIRGSCDRNDRAALGTTFEYMHQNSKH